MKNFQFAVFNTDKTYGITIGNKSLHPAGLSSEETLAISRANKEKIANEVGFDLSKLFIPLQGEERGTSFVLKKEDVASYKDLYDLDVYADIAKMSKETEDEKTAIGFNVSDAANVIAMNLKTMEATSTFCAGQHINAHIPEKIIEVLGGSPEDIYVDISPYGYKIPYYNPADKNWEPAWVSNEEAWSGCKERLENGIIVVDQQKALTRELTKSGILLDHIYDRGDSYYNDLYYSTQRARMINDPSQNGRFLHGVAYVEEGKTYNNSNIKVYTKK